MLIYLAMTVRTAKSLRAERELSVRQPYGDHIALFDLTLDDLLRQCRFNGMGKQPPQWTSPEIGIESLI